MDETLVKKLSSKSTGWIKEGRESGYKRYKGSDVPKWKRLSLKDFTLPDYKGYSRLSITPGNADVKDIMDTGMQDDVKDIIDSGLAFGVDDKFVSMVDSFFNTGVVIRPKKDKEGKSPVIIRYPSDGDLILDQNVIIAEPFTTARIVIDYDTLSSKNSFHDGVTRVLAKEGSRVELTVLQRLSDSSYNFNSVLGILEDDAVINWSVIEMGSRNSAVNYTTYMRGQGSENRAKGAFLLDGDRRLDLSFKVNHLAPHTTSDIDIRGALKDNSYSIFRGDLDMKHGAKGAKGNESESVTLLDKTVRSDAIPALKCADDDVEAGHAASCGELDKNVLFYMMSRGLSYDDARMMLVEAGFNPVIDALPDDGLKNDMRDIIKRRLIGSEND